jgi:hypothetical protein
MKIVLFLSQFSAFSEHNLKTYEVNTFIGDKLVNISIDENTTIDVSFKEVIVVDFHNEMQRLFDSKNWGLFTDRKQKAWNFLSSYAERNKLNLGFLQYEQTI